MNEPLTILFLQKVIANGEPAQLDAAIEAAQRYSPKSRVVVLTDTPDKWECASFCLDHYWEAAAKYAEMYQHTSQLSADFELFNIQRWLVMNEFCWKMGIERIFHADSDVLIFSDLEEERKKWADCDYTLSTDEGGCTQGGNAFFSRVALACFAKHIVERGGQGGNDMGLLGEFRNTSQLNWGETSEIIEGAAGDHHLQTQFWKYKSDGVVKANGMESKKLDWYWGQPYAETLEGKRVRLLWLHCWGNYKRRMRELLDKGIESGKMTP